MTDSESDIITAVKRGQRERFGELYDMYVHRIYGYIFRRVSHRETAEDLTSVVFMKAVDKLATFRTGSFSAWLYTIAHHAVVDHYRTQRPQLDLMTVAEPTAPGDLETQTDARQQLAGIREKLQALPPVVQDIITMRVWDDLPFADIARVVGKTPAAVKMSFARGVRQLQPQFISLVLIYLLVAYGRFA